MNPKDSIVLSYVSHVDSLKLQAYELRHFMDHLYRGQITGADELVKTVTLIGNVTREGAINITSSIVTSPIDT